MAVGELHVHTKDAILAAFEMPSCQRLVVVGTHMFAVFFGSFGRPKSIRRIDGTTALLPTVLRTIVAVSVQGQRS